MAQLALTLAGSAVGLAYGSVLGSAILAGVGSVVGGYIDSLWMGSKVGGGQAPKTIDLKVSSASYGQPIAIPYGTIEVPSEMIAASPLFATKHDVAVGGGLGFGSQGSGGIVFTYSTSFAVMWGEPPIGQIIKILRIWADKKLIYDVRPQARHTRRRGAAIRNYPGSSTQLPDPWLQAFFGANVTPAYRGRAVTVFQHLQLADFGNHIPNMTAEVATSSADVHPFSSVDPGGGSHFSRDVAFDDDRGLIFKLGILGDIAKMDARLVTVLLGPLNVVAGAVGANPVLGGDGFLYVAQDAYGVGGTFNFVKWSKIDPVSLAIVDQVGGLSTTFDDGTPDGGPPPVFGNNLLAYTSILKSRAGWPYLLGMATSGGFAGFELQIVSIGQIDATAGFPFANQMRFVAKTRYGGSLPYDNFILQDGEIDLSSLTNAGSPTAPKMQCDIWATDNDGNFIHRLQLTDNLALGGGTFAGGANGANPLVMMETIDLSAAWSGNVNPATLSFLTEEHALIVLRGTKIIKYNLDSRTVTGAELDIGAASGSEMIQGPVDGLMYFGGPGSHIVKEVDVIAWSINRTIDLHDFDAGFTLASQKYSSLDGALWFRNGTALVKLFLGRATGGDVGLDFIVSDICLRAGLAAGDIDVTDLSGLSASYVIPRQMPARDAIAPLGQAFMFQAVESDFKLKFVRMGGAVARALTLSDIGAYAGTTRPVPLKITDANQRTLARRVNCRYINRGDNYQTGSAKAQRHQAIVGSKSEITLDLPVVLTADEATNICEKLLAKIWTNARKFDFATSFEQLRLDSMDVITIDDGAQVHRMGVDQMDIGADGTVKFSATREDADDYVDGFALGAGGGGGPRPNPVIGHTDIELLDVVLLRDGDDHKGFYIAAASDTGDSDAWLGWNLLRSSDKGESYSLFATGSVAALMGHATTALAPPVAWDTWDRINSVTIRALPDAPIPSSSTEAAVLNGTNQAILGSEIISFVTAVDNGDGTYTLSVLLRGQRGSDPFIGKHALGDRFILVDFASLTDAADADLGLPRDYKSQSVGDGTIPSSFQVFNDTGNRLRPLTPVSPAMAADANGNLLISWIRRTRIGGENDWADGVTDVPLGEASESYQVDIYNGASVVRTLAASSPQVAYMLDQQVTDFGSARTSVRVIIYQLSAIVGRGFGTDVTLTILGATALPVLPIPIEPPPAPGTAPFDIILEWLDFAPIPPDQLIGMVKFDRTVVIPAGLGGSAGNAKDHATAQADVDVRKNGVSFATIRFPAGAAAAVLISALGATLVENDLLEFVAPHSPDATLGRLTATIKATRSA